MIAAAMAIAALAGRIPWKAYAATALLLAGWWAVDRAYDRGRADCAAAASRSVAEERLRQAAANAEALQAGAEIATTLADENDRLKTLVAGSILTGCASSTGSAVRPSLAEPPAGLTRECDDPVRLAAAADAGTAASQAAVVGLWARDRAALVACKRRHQGLRTFYGVRDVGLRG